MKTLATVSYTHLDGFNRLSEVSTKSGRVRYQYNAEGIRTSKSINNQKTEFLLDGVNVIGEVSNGSGVTTYLRGVTGLISQKKPDNSKLYYMTNGHGDVTALVNPSGSITKTYTLSLIHICNDTHSSCSDSSAVWGRICGRQPAERYQ